METGHGIIAWIIIGLVAGWLTGKIIKGSGFGFIMDMVVGLAGALVGGFIGAESASTDCSEASFSWLLEP